ncbi:MAG: amidohydrolase family protein [Anaerolineae bacterium]
MDSDLYRRLKDEIDRISVIDTHEHIEPERQRLGRKLDVFYLFSHYASSDVISAGLPIREIEWVRDLEQSLDERWRRFSPFWERARDTAYCQVVLIAIRDLFGIDDLNDDTYRAISEKLVESNREGWLKYVLRERANIEVAIQNVDHLDVDPELFVPVQIWFDMFAMASSRKELWDLEARAGISIHTFDDLLRGVDITFEQAIEAGIVGVKTALAYQRPIHFEKVTKHDAEAAFNRITYHLDPLQERWYGPGGSAWRELKPMQDYVIHYTIRRAIDLGLPVQVHTGLQEGSGNVIINSNPVLLANLFNEYPEAQFDVFHGGYPYCSEMATLAKNFPNVYIDMCWLHAISPTVSRRALHEWLETVPSNKVLGFGGDYLFVEGTYGHLQLAKRDIARVLAEKVEERYLSEERAVRLAHKLLRENAMELFKLDRRCPIQPQPAPEG